MNAKLLIGMGLAVGMAGCASTPQPNAALESARTEVRSAEADPNVSQFAAVDMQAARKQLDLAEAAYANHQDAAIAQPAYMAMQTARLAKARADAKADDARVAAGQVERDRIQLAARSREVDSANRATNAANAATNAANMAANAASLAANEALGQRDQANQQAMLLQAEVDQLKAKPTPRGLVLTLGDVLFDTGRAELNPGSARKLDQLAQFLSEHPSRRVQIDGFTDSVGTDSYNQDLGGPTQSRMRSSRAASILRGSKPRAMERGFPSRITATRADDR